MNANELAVVQKRFESPDEVRTFEKGKLEVVRIGPVSIGRATYEPGWQWSKHVGPQVGAARCHVEHVGMVVSGTATVAFDDGTVVELRPGALYLGPGHPARQLGGRRRALRLAPLHGRRQLRQVANRARRGRPSGQDARTTVFADGHRRGPGG